MKWYLSLGMIALSLLFNVAQAANSKEGDHQGRHQSDRYMSREHQSEFSRPYMYVNPAFPEFYSNFYDNDNTQFYFFYQNDNSHYYSETPSNYDNDTDYSWGESNDSPPSQ